MTQHKWHKEIHAWADGAEIEAYSAGIWFSTDYPNWDVNNEFRIKSQPKKKKYLYAYFDLLTGAVIFNTTTQWSNANKNLELIGKIEVEND
jgi:hypothetical protein